MNNNKQCAYWSLVIHEGAKSYDNLKIILEDLLNDNPNIEYSYIYHIADEDCDKRHIHLVLYFKGKVKRFTTIQTIFEGAHIEQTNSSRYKRCIQYLIHKNNPEKKQYPQMDIISNIETSYLADILNGCGYDFELFVSDKLFDYINEFYSDDGVVTMQKFIVRFGLDGVQKYYFIIKDCVKEFLNNIAVVKSRTAELDIHERAFNVYAKDIKNEWKLAKYYGYTKLDFDDYYRMCYETFLLDIEKGYIDINNLLKGEC